LRQSFIKSTAYLNQIYVKFEWFYKWLIARPPSEWAGFWGFEHWQWLMREAFYAGNDVKSDAIPAVRAPKSPNLGAIWLQNK
jgi:hypothetical protein